MGVRELQLPLDATLNQIGPKDGQRAKYFVGIPDGTS